MNSDHEWDSDDLHIPPESPTTSLTLALRPEKYAAVSSVKHETLCRCPPAETRDLYLDQESSFDPFINRTEQQLDRPTLICMVDLDRRKMTEIGRAPV